MSGSKRISAKEAAEFLGVPYQNISRIDRQGEFIKRYRLGHKTYVYDLESLEVFLEAKRVKPILPPGPPKVTPARKSTTGSKESFLQKYLLEKPRFSLLDLLPESERPKRGRKRDRG